MRSVKLCTFVPLSSVFFYFDFSRTSANGQLSIRDSYDRRAVYRKPHFLLQKVTKLDSYRALLVPVSVSLITLDFYMLNKRFLKNIVATPPPPQNRCHIIPLPPHNDHASTTATFLRP